MRVEQSSCSNYPYIIIRKRRIQDKYIFSFVYKSRYRHKNKRHFSVIRIESKAILYQGLVRLQKHSIKVLSFSFER